MPNKRLNYVGHKSGKLTAIEWAKPDSRGDSQFLCVCECGNKTIVRGKHLKSGAVKSCGQCPNKFEHLPNGVTVLTLERRDGSTLSCFIDTPDYSLVKDYRWHAVEIHRTLYAVTTAKGKRLGMHQLLGGKGFDHKDHNGLNNRRTNLRPADGAESNRNRRKQKDATSNYLGVSWDSHWKKFRVAINDCSLGSFDSEVEAALTYDAAARKRFGEFACLNFPNPGEQGAIRSIDDAPESDEQ